jgi:hypothetical protein
MRRLLCAVSLAGFLAVAAVPSALAAEWRVPGDFPTIQAAVNSPDVAAGDLILVGPGNHYGALLTKSVEIRGEDGAVINDGPPHSSGKTEGFRLFAGSQGTTISHLTFEVDLAVINGKAVNNVTVSHNRFLNANQAVTNWGGSGWDISHNDIVDLKTDNGGGIGILIGDYAANPDGVHDNLVAHNRISGVLHVAADDDGGYSGAGIVLYADFRWGDPGAVAIAYNRVLKNKVAVVSDTPLVVDIHAFEMTDTRHEVGVIFENAIGFNDFRGTAIQIDISPPELAAENTLSRNLGTSRGKGLHPSVFR